MKKAGEKRAIVMIAHMLLVCVTGMTSKFGLCDHHGNWKKNWQYNEAGVFLTFLQTTVHSDKDFILRQNMSVPPIRAERWSGDIVQVICHVQPSEYSKDVLLSYEFISIL